MIQEVKNHIGHQPQDSILYRVIQENVETFFTQRELEDPNGVPKYIREEFYL
jgi:hypothetical protein